MRLSQFILTASTFFLVTRVFQDKPPKPLADHVLVGDVITEHRVWNGECWGEMPIAATSGLDIISLQQFRSAMQKASISPCVDMQPGRPLEGNYLFCVPEAQALTAQDTFFSEDQINRACFTYVYVRDKSNLFFSLPRPYAIWQGEPTITKVRSKFGADSVPALKRVLADRLFLKLRRNRHIVRIAMCARIYPALWNGRPAYDLFFDFGDHKISRFQIMPIGPVWFASTLNQLRGPEELRSVSKPSTENQSN